MMRLHLRDGLCACVLLFIFSQSALAVPVEYNYTGNQFTDNHPTNHLCNIGDTGCYNNVTAVIGMTTALLPNQALASILSAADYWSISDGRTTITDQTQNIIIDLQARTDSNGDIDIWYFNVVDGAQLLNQLYVLRTSYGVFTTDVDHTRYCTVDPGTGCTVVDTAFVSDAPGQPQGAWVVSTVPVPAAVWLFASGLLGLIGLSRRR